MICDWITIYKQSKVNLIVSVLSMSTSSILLLTRSTELQREWRRVHGPGLPIQLQSENQAHADVLQAPPAEDHEVLLRHQPQSRCQGPETARPENRPHQEGLTGNIWSPPPHMRPCFTELRPQEETDANRAMKGFHLCPKQISFIPSTKYMKWDFHCRSQISFSSTVRY